MKRVISLLLIISMCLCLFACDGSLKLTEEEIISALEPSEDDILTTTGSKNNITSFSYTVKNDATSKLRDRDYVLDAFVTMIDEGSYGLTRYQVEALAGALAVLSVFNVFSNEEDDANFNAADTIIDILDVMSDGKTKELYGWKISAKINTNSITITASK